MRKMWFVISNISLRIEALVYMLLTGSHYHSYFVVYREKVQERMTGKQRVEYFLM